MICRATGCGTTRSLPCRIWRYVYQGDEAAHPVTDEDRLLCKGTENEIRMMASRYHYGRRRHSFPIAYEQWLFRLPMGAARQPSGAWSI